MWGLYSAILTAASASSTVFESWLSRLWDKRVWRHELQVQERVGDRFGQAVNGAGALR